MRKRNNEEEVRVYNEMPTYTNEDLNKFDEWLKQFRKTGDDNGYHFDHIDLNEAAVGFGAMKKHGEGKSVTYGVIVTALEVDDYGNPKRIETPTKYELFNHKLEALSKLKSRRAYGEQKRNESYEKMETQIAPVMPEPPKDYYEDF